MSWRRIAILATASLAVLALALGAATTASSKPSATVTLTFWNGFTGPDRPVLEKLVKQFNASQKNVKIEMTIMPWDVFYQKLLPSFASGKGPDIVGMASEQLPQYADRNVFKPLDKIYSQGLNKNTLVRSAVEAGKWEGKYYAITMNFTTLLMYWNNDMLRAAGMNAN